MTILTPKTTISDPFTLINTGDIQGQIGIKTIRFKSRITGKQHFIQFDTYTEVLANAVSPIRGAIFLNRLANAGFQVSPISNSLETFFHAALFPEDSITIMGAIRVDELPEGAVVEIISSHGETTENHHEH